MRTKTGFFITALALLLSLHTAGQPNTVKAFSYTTADSIITPISLQYEQRSFLHRLVMGKNYRDTWSRPVKFPVLYLSQTGLTIDKLGGGQQTKSLRLKEASGKEWVLRTVNKTVTNAIPKTFHNTPVEAVVQDMISASHPYSPLIVAELAKAAGVIAPVPTMYFVAADKAFGEYNYIFANTICLLEEREPTPDGSGTENTEEVKQKILEADHVVLQKKVLQARLLDMLVGDWDRHADQWRWDDIDSAQMEYYYAIPRDRDNALFYSGGLLPALAKISFMPHISGFREKSTALKKLNRKSHAFDKLFLNELSRSDWEAAILQFTNAISDSVIEASIAKLPPTIYSADGATIAGKLKSRRDGLRRNAMKYYAYLAGTVRINGSEKADRFIVSGENNNIIVRIMDSMQRFVVYERVFNPEETGHIYLYGLEGNDQFIVEENARSRLKLVVYGNAGKDHYDFRGEIRSRIYDLEADGNTISSRNAAKFRFK